MKRKITKIFSSTAGIVLTIAIVVAINIIGWFLYQRWDLTENRLYTLSAASKKIIAKLDTPVVIKFYYSKSNPYTPMFLKNYANQVADLLQEYRQAGHGKIVIRKLDPKPDSDAEDAAIMDGIDGKLLSTGNKLYLGLAVSCLDKTVAVPFLSPSREALLEYDITSAISKVYNSKPTVIGVMSALPVMGSGPTPAMMRRGQYLGLPAWTAINTLKQNFKLRKVPLNAEKIADDIKVLLLIHPAGISDKTQFAIDQFVLRGGKLIAFLDPKSYAAALISAQDHQAALAGRESSSLDKLLRAWGIKFTASQVVLDSVAGRRTHLRGRALFMPAILDLTHKDVAADNVITSQLNSLCLVFGGAFTGEPTAGLKKSVLIHSSDRAILVNRRLVGHDNNQADFSIPKCRTYALAIQLSGTFKTAFPDGCPGTTEKSDKTAKKQGATKRAKTAKPWLKVSKGKNMVLLFGDSDMLFDTICIRLQSFLGQKLVMQLNDNLNLLQNCVDLVGGDKDMIGIRCRKAMIRPFERAKELQAAAENKFRQKIKELEHELAQTQQRLTELQRNKKAGQRFILSPEQQRELQKFKARRAQIRKDIKSYRKELRREVDALGNRLKWLNIAAMPLLIALLGAIVAFNRKRQERNR